MNKELFPICRKGKLTEKVDKTLVVRDGKEVLVDSLYSVCDSCGCEQANARQTKANKLVMRGLYE